MDYSSFKHPKRSFKYLVVACSAVDLNVSFQRSHGGAPGHGNNKNSNQRMGEISGDEDIF